MRTTLLLFLMLLMTSVLPGQKPGIEMVNRTTLNFKAKLSFARDNVPNTQLIGSIVSLDNGALNAVISKPRVKIVSGDVVIEFALKSSNVDNVSIRLEEVKNLDRNITLDLEDWLFGDVGEQVAKVPNTKKIIIANTASNRNPLELEGEVSFRLTAELFDYKTFRGNFFRVQVKCNQEPPPLKLFKFKRGYLPNLIGLGVAGGVYYLGSRVENRAQEIYDDEYRVQETKAAAEPFYRSANNKNQDAQYYKTAAYIILIADGAWTIFQQLIQNERKRTYQNNKCVASSPWQIKPVYYGLQIPENGAVYAGLGLTYNF